MRVSLKNLRINKRWSLEFAARIYGMGVKKLKSYEEYRKIPSPEEIIIILKMTGVYFDEILFLVYEDIQKHYRRRSKI